MRTVPAIIPYVRKAIDTDPNISGRMMKEQFEKLILQPLSEVERISITMRKLVIVIDALDECERESDVKNILYLLSQTQHLKSNHIRIFLTSRPELPIRLGFRKMSADVVLQDIPQAIIEHDISSFLKSKFAKIKDDYNCSHLPDSSLPADWPGNSRIRTLTNMASPLFISAAVVCRFVGDPRWHPEERLTEILRYQTSNPSSSFDGIYLPVLDRLIKGLTNFEKEIIVLEFREVVGSIAVLATPLSKASIAGLVDLPENTVGATLDSLHSVFSIPTNRQLPVRLIHLSFREFILDPEERGKSPFWVDEKERHDAIATRCLKLMSKHLRKNICRLELPETLHTEVKSKAIDEYLPADIRYACQYWVYHLEQSKRSVRDRDAVHVFLLEHFLHWLEALSLIRKLTESIAMISTLHSLMAVSHSI